MINNIYSLRQLKRNIKQVLIDQTKAIEKYARNNLQIATEFRLMHRLMI